MTNTTVKHNAISVQTELTLHGNVCSVIIQAENAAEVHEHLAGLLGNGQADDQTAKKAEKPGGKASAKKKSADTAEVSTTPAEDSAPAAEQSKEAKQEEPENPTKADPEPTQTAQHTPAETDTAPEATATSSASTTDEPSIEPKDVLEKAKALLAEKGGEAKLQGILKAHGASRASTVPAEKLQDVYDDLLEALGENSGGLL